jgi:hypothetical protein
MRYTCTSSIRLRDGLIHYLSLVAVDDFFIKAGTFDVSDSDNTRAVFNVLVTAPGYTDSAVRLEANRVSSSAFKLVELLFGSLKQALQ